MLIGMKCALNGKLEIVEEDLAAHADGTAGEAAFDGLPRVDEHGGEVPGAAPIAHHEWRYDERAEHHVDDGKAIVVGIVGRPQDTVR